MGGIHVEKNRWKRVIILTLAVLLLSPSVMAASQGLSPEDQQLVDSLVQQLAALREQMLEIQKQLAEIYARAGITTPYGPGGTGVGPWNCPMWGAYQGYPATGQTSWSGSGWGRWGGMMGGGMMGGGFARTFGYLKSRQPPWWMSRTFTARGLG